MYVFLQCRQALASHGGHTKKLHGGRGPTSCDLDQEVLAHVERNAGGGVALTDKQLQQVARECAGKLGVTGFKASGSWLRGWKGRCQGAGHGVRGRGTRSRKEDQKEERDVNGSVVKGLLRNGILRCEDQMSLNDPHETTPTARQQLSTLTKEEKMGVVNMGGARVCVDHTPSCAAEGAGVAPLNCCTSPESHDHLTTPTQMQGATPTHLQGAMPTHPTQLQEDTPTQLVTPTQLQEDTPTQLVTPTHLRSATPTNLQGATPTCIQVCLGELLEEVSLLQSHDQQLHLDLGPARGEVGVAGRVGPQDHSMLLMSCDSGNMLSQHVLPTPTLSECHNHAGFPDHARSSFSGHTPSLLEEEEQLMSVFNHRSFTDHFPFLPPSLFSNWSSPYDTPHHSHSEGLEQDTPTFDNPPVHARAMRSKVRRSGSDGCQTRSMVAKARAAAASVSTSNTSNTNSTRSFSLSPSTFLDSSSSPPALGGVSLLASPRGGGGGGVVSSPPGGGLLANRLSQPTFPDEPEIIFHEIQLGPLHTTPATPTPHPQLP